MAHVQLIQKNGKSYIEIAEGGLSGSKKPEKVLARARITKEDVKWLVPQLLDFFKN